jgi:hypothetical protein
LYSSNIYKGSFTPLKTIIDGSYSILKDYVFLDISDNNLKNSPRDYTLDAS